MGYLFGGLGRSWAPPETLLGSLWAPLGCLLTALGRLFATLGRLFAPSVTPEPPKSHFTRFLTDFKLRDINIEDTFSQHLLECMVVVARKARILGTSTMWATMNNKQQIHYTYAVPRCRFVASAARQLPPLIWQATLTLSFVYLLH